MDGSALKRNIVGLSVEKWTVYQLKQLLPAMKDVDAATFTTDGNVHERVTNAVKLCVTIFDEKSLHKQLLAVSRNVDLMFCILRALTLYACQGTASSTEANELWTKSLNILTVYFSIFCDTTVMGESASAAEEDGAGDSILSALSGIGSQGIEELAATVLDSVHATLMGVFKRVSFGQTASSEEKAVQSIRFALSFLRFVHVVLQFHSNRRKLFTSLCELLLPDLLQLLSLCTSLLEQRDHELPGTVARLVSPLQGLLLGVLEKGLFDERAVDELASMRLAETSAVGDAHQTAGAGGGSKAGKKTKKAGAEDEGAQEGGVPEEASVVSRATTKTFYDVLLRVLARMFQEAVADRAEAGRVRRLAGGTAALLQVYCARSKAMAMQASAQGQRAPGVGHHGAARSEALGADMANTRRHLGRVFHMTFLLLEVCDRDSDASSDAIHSSTDMVELPPPAGGKTNKKRSAGDMQAAPSSSPPASQARDTAKAQVRRAVLQACVQALDQQAIPNHDSMARYVQRFHALSQACVRDGEALVGLVGGAGVDVSQLLALHMHCIREIAAIDHNTVVETQLAGVMRLLAGVQSSAGTENTEDGEGGVQEAGKQLVQVLIRVHAQLRLMDQFVLTAVQAASQEEHVAKGRDCLLLRCLRADEAASLLVQQLMAIPTGQVTTVWTHLAQCGGTISAVACHLAQIFMHAQQCTVRSTSSGADGPPGRQADSVDPMVQGAVGLLCKLTQIVQALVAARTERDPALQGLPAAEVALETVSALLRFMCHHCSGCAAQLLLPAKTPTTPAADEGISFFQLAVTSLLNALVALPPVSFRQLALAKTALSLLLLCSNVTAKAAAASSHFAPQMKIAQRFAVGLLKAPAGAEGPALELLVLLLRDVRIWGRGEGQEVGEKALRPLFAPYLAAQARNEGREGAVQVRLRQVRELLDTSVVQDCSAVRSALCAALLKHWAQMASSPGQKGVDGGERARQVLGVLAAVPEALLYAAPSLLPGLFQHMQFACERLAEMEQDALSGQDARALIASAEAAAAVLLGHVRSAPHRRLRLSQRWDGTAEVPTQAEDRNDACMSAVLACCGGPPSSQPINVAAVETAVPVLLALLRTLCRHSNGMESGSSQCVMWAMLCVDVFLTYSLRQGAARVYSQIWAGLTELSVRESSGATRELVRAALNVLLWQPGEGPSAQAIDHVQDMLGQLLVSPQAPPSSAATSSSAAGKGKRKGKQAADTIASTPSGSAFTDGRFFLVGEVAETLCALRRRGGGSESTLGLSDQDTAMLVNQLLTAASTFPQVGGGAETSQATGSEGWLRLCGLLAGPLLLQTGSVAVSVEEGDTADLAQHSAIVNVTRLQALCGILVIVIAQGVQQGGGGAGASFAVTCLTCSLLQYVLRCRLCNLDSNEALNLLHTSLLMPLAHSEGSEGNIVIATDLLMYMTEHGRALLTTGNTAAADRFAKFHADLTSLVGSTLREAVARLRVHRAEDVDRVTHVLQLAHSVTVRASLAVQKQSRSAGRRKQPRRDGDAKTAAVFRFDVWCDGLLNLLALAASHVHVWVPATAPRKEEESCAVLNAASVRLVKALLVGLDRLVAVCTANALPNLNTAVGGLCSLLTSTMTALLGLEAALTASGGTSTEGERAQAAEGQLELVSCYHLLCRICGGVGSSAVLEKHIHFIASAVVEALSKARVTRQFQELAYPGIYALFERCQARQKTQMFAMLDAQAWVLMTDLHGEFMRSFKFVGK